MINKVLIILAIALSCIITRNYYLDKHEAFIQKLNAEASTREAELQGVINDLLEESHNYTIEIYKLSSDNAKLVRKLGGLRDPGNSYTYKNDCSSGNNEANTGTVLSDEATEFLLDITREADLLREQLRLCQEWAKSVSTP